MTHYFPGYRVFIFGQEVTDDVISLSVNHHDGQSPSTCSITLANIGNRYSMSAEDITAYAYQAQDTVDIENILISDLQKAWFTLARDNLEEVITDDIKQRVVLSKLGITVKGKPVSLKSPGRLSLRKVYEATGEYQKYSYMVNDCIFHSTDPIRIFLRDPVDPTKWYYGFSGYVTDRARVNSPDGVRTVEIMGEDVSRVLRLSRASNQPGVFDSDAVSTSDDFLITTFSQDVFREVTLPEFAYTLIFGSTLVNSERINQQLTGGTGVFQGVTSTVGGMRYSVNGSPTTVDKNSGLFNFKDSFIYEIGEPGGTSESIGSSLLNKLQNGSIEDYLFLTSHEVGLAEYGEVFDSIEAAITQVGSHPELYPVEGRVIMLVAGELNIANNVNLLLKDITLGPAEYSQYSNRLTLLYNVFARIDHSVFTSPRGDVLIEMPLYDMPPMHRVTLDETINVQETFRDERVRTMILSWGSLFGAWKEFEAQGVYTKPEVARAEGLLPLYGARVEVVEPTGILSRDALNAAKIYGESYLNKWNADAYSSNIQMLPRPDILFPNRPVYFDEGTQISTVRSAAYKIDWESESCDSTLGVNYKRGWRGEFDEGQPVFEQIGGWGSQALNYAVGLGFGVPTVSYIPNLKTLRDQEQ